jgi:hypothetical protein
VTYRVVGLALGDRVVLDGSDPDTDGAGDLRANWLTVLHADHARVLTVTEFSTLLLILGEGIKTLPFAANGATIFVGFRHGALRRVCIECFFVYVYG